MLAGHYAPALAIKALFPRTPLWLLFVGVQAVDIAWGLFVLSGVEVARIQPGFTASNGLVLEQVVWSHSLIAALAWSAGVGLIVQFALARPAVAVATGLAVLSHWFLDLPMHVADLPFAGNSGPKFGFGLWQHREASFLLEAGLLTLGGWLWSRGPGQTVAPGRRVVLAGSLGLLAVAGYYGPQPEDIGVTAAFGLVVYLLVPMLGRWVEGPGRA